jgi:hypothetical protein
MHPCLHLLLLSFSELVRLTQCARSATANEARILERDQDSVATPLQVIHDFIPKKGTKKAKLHHFVESFEFFDGPDPTYGHVKYLNRSDSQSHVPRPLVDIDERSGHAFLYAEPSHNVSEPPRSLRLESRLKLEKNSLLIGDFRHLPDLCGSWPAFWLLGEEPWPRNGEVDIVENVGGELAIVNEQTHTALHTEQSCHVGQERETHFMNHGFFFKKDCAWKWGKNAEGCTVLRMDRHSFGTKFNERKGGAYAVLWTDSFFEMWFWTRPKVPRDVKNGIVSVESMKKWGLPYARFNLGNLCSPNHFRNMSIIMNTAFCGGFAGKTFKTMCPFHGRRNGAVYWQTHNGDDNCVKFFSMKHGRTDVRNKAYWEIQSLRVYRYPQPEVPKYNTPFYPILTPGAEWCRNPAGPAWKVEDVKVNQCIAYMDKGSHEKFQIGHVAKVTEPHCASLPSARAPASADELELSDDGDDEVEEIYEAAPALVQLDHEFAQVAAKTLETQSFLEVDNMAPRCHRTNTEYGNWMEGACGASNTLALYAEDTCVENLLSQDWFNKSAQISNTSMTIQLCQEACVKMGQDCGYYNFHRGKGWCPNSCWLKKSLRCGAKGYTSALGWVSGPRVCPKKRKLCTMTYNVPAKTRDSKIKYGTELMCFNSKASCPEGCAWQEGRCMKAGTSSSISDSAPA